VNIKEVRGGDIVQVLETGSSEGLNKARRDQRKRNKVMAACPTTVHCYVFVSACTNTVNMDLGATKISNNLEQENMTFHPTPD